MSLQVDEVFNAALALPPENRAELADKLLESLEDREEIDALWAIEAERRLRDFEEGKTKAIPAEEVFAKYPRNK